ncbi:MAG: trypsin-like peptidase domain-containing protein [Psychroflexus sp.]
MKDTFKLALVAIIASGLSIGSYHFIYNDSSENEEKPTFEWSSESVPLVQTSSNTYDASPDNFTAAAENTVDAVVHVKNMTLMRTASSYFEYKFGGGETKKVLRGAGSGVIVSPDGYIVTNNHVIEGANEVQVTLNDNETFTAEIIGTAPESDIALLKIERDGLKYLQFGDSNSIRIGEWVLAVGNPFNLTSTVTAGIISAKARDLNNNDNQFQSFIQTDAAVNPGNSGGALVNTKGELIGINTAITSQTGSFIGYSFAVPSNNAKKIIEDLIEYGSVRKAVLGVRGTDINEQNYKQLETEISQGFLIGDVSKKSGAEKAGLQKDDIITKIDNIRIRRFSDMAGYLNSRNPGDKVNVTYLRNGKTKETTIQLDILSTYLIKSIGIEVQNIEKKDLKKFGNAKNGVGISEIFDKRLENSFISESIITKINKEEVNSIEDVRKIINQSKSQTLLITFMTKDGEESTYVFR